MGISLSSGIRLPVYSVANAAALAALTNMQTADLCLQIDTKVWYSYDGATWNKVADVSATSGASLQLVETKTLAADANTTFSNLTQPTSYLCVLNVIGSAAQTIGLQFNGDAGAHYNWKGMATTDAITHVNNATSLPLIDLNVVGKSSSMFLINSTGSSSGDTYITVSSMSATYADNLAKFIQGVWSTTTVGNHVTSIKILASAGTMTGTISLYKFKTA